MSPAQMYRIDSNEFTRCEERSHLMEYGKSLTSGQKTDAAIKGSIDRAVVAFGNNDITLATRGGMSIRFHESDVREMGRATTGVKGIELDGRSDLYSLGIVCYEMLTGTVPFRADSSMSVAIKHLIDPMPSLPSELATYQPFIDRLTAKDRNERYATGADAAQALRRVHVAVDGDRRYEARHLARLDGVPYQVAEHLPQQHLIADIDDAAGAATAFALIVLVHRAAVAILDVANAGGEPIERPVPARPPRGPPRRLRSPPVLVSAQGRRVALVLACRLSSGGQHRQASAGTTMQSDRDGKLKILICLLYYLPHRTGLTLYVQQLAERLAIALEEPIQEQPSTRVGQRPERRGRRVVHVWMLCD